MRRRYREPAYAGKKLCAGVVLAAINLIFNAYGEGCGGSTVNLRKEGSMSYWLHRISYHAEVSHPLLDEGYLSIGWSDFSNNEFIEKVRTGDRVYFDSAIKNEWGGDVLSRARWSLWKYLVEMRKDDLVIVPGWKDFSVYKIVGDCPVTATELVAESGVYKVDEKGYLIREVDGKTEDIDLGFFWKVEPVCRGIPRDQYADQALTARMKIRSTTASLTDLKASVDTAMERFFAGTPINLYSSILAESQGKVLSLIRNDLNPAKFEILVKWYFERVGATSVSIPSKNEPGKEGDADVVAVFEGIKTIIYAQAKHYNGEASSWALEQISAYVSHKERQNESMDDGYTRIAWVVSSADCYSKECYEKAQQNQVLLIDGAEFSRMLLEAGIAGLEGIF
jgi:hypothetical protein